ncbi:histidine kinase/DNA gyrase B/HSP90-like ATPase [Natranaerovirga hydrolytica]|uniref:Histidine kinase/DNA gyrase B/HSP90-like ATPase n=2 Tax=Natranaerovirga hydrolytica TaxID=680378 RepID=A0A4R1N1R4_9FIRM|nr:histidine kinase/DNA gyrase B/HSP90-like ATPase [Natranaerovirga hydrolytica]
MMIVKKWLTLLKNSFGAKLNLIFSIVICLFIFFSLYNQSLLNKFSTEHSRNIYLYDNILELKENLIQGDIALSEYFRSGNRTSLASFNHYSDQTRKILSDLSDHVETDEQIYLLRSIDNSFATYYNECSNASFLYNTREGYDYIDKMYYAQSINAYLLRYGDDLLHLVLEESIDSNNKLVQQQSLLTFWNYIIIISLILFFFSCITYINVNITKPLNILKTKATEISNGNLNVAVPVNTPETTIGVLSETFNKMIKNIREMMESIQENVKTEKKLLEEQRKNIEFQSLLNQATFLALQTQTNPHFLFNTLNSISRTITLEKYEQALLMIDSLAALLRYSLTDAEVAVTLEEELTITQEYLNIQNHRFSDRIHSKIVCDDDLAKRIVLPRFTLQPLVENAIIHGLEPKEEGGKVKIVVRKKGNFAVIDIIDSGLGIPKKLLKELQNKTFELTSKNIGIKNTQQRIILFTKNEHAFIIKSKEKMGTLVRITLPLKEATNV